MSLSANVNEKAALIWAIADKLTGVYKPHEYGEVILPLTVIRRFDCYTKITVEPPLLDENGKLVLKKGRKGELRVMTERSIIDSIAVRLHTLYQSQVPGNTRPIEMKLPTDL